MFIVLPIVSFICLLLIFHNYKSWRESFLSGAISWGILFVFITELLNLGKLITSNWLVLAWLFINLILIFILGKFYYKKTNKIELNKYLKHKFKLSLVSKLLLCSIAFILSMIALTALIAAPNNWDSMSYHLARVVNWVQNHSVDYYPTSYLPQLYQKPFSGYAIMHFQILSGSDHFANLIQWFCLLGSVIGVSLIAMQLGASSQGQILSSVICVTIPMGILQGSSTQSDYVVSFWIVCFVYFILLALQARKINAYLIFQIGASLGLACFTKGTAYLYTFPFFMWFLFSGIKRFGWKLSKPLLGITILVFIININHELRNIDLFGYPLASGSEKYTNDIFTIPVFLSNIIRNISLHLYIPIPILRHRIEELINLVHSFLGIGVSDPRTTWPNTEFNLPNGSDLFHEDSASNTLHLLLIIGTILIFLLIKKLRNQQMILPYLIAVVSCFLIFSLLLKWQPWHSRLHLPIFVLFSPFVGTVLSRLSSGKITNSLVIITVISSLLWVFFNMDRPLIFPTNAKLKPINYGNIFNTSRIDQYFTHRKELKEPYMEVVSILNERQCSDVGLSLQGDDWEYPFWVLLQNNLAKKYTIRQVNVPNSSSKKFDIYPYNEFFPCAIIDLKNSDLDQSSDRYIKVWSKNSISLFIIKKSGVVD